MSQTLEAFGHNEKVSKKSSWKENGAFARHYVTESSYQL